MASLSAVVAVQSSLNQHCFPFIRRTIGYWRCTIPRLELVSYHSPRFLSVCATRTKENYTTNGSTSEMFTPTDPSTLSSGGLEDVISQSTSSAFQPVDLSSVGLGGMWPPTGWIQSSLEIMYNYTHLPWWGCILALTVVFRLCLLPNAVKMRVAAAKLVLVNKDAPAIHEKMMECARSGDEAGQATAGVTMMKLYKKHDTNPFAMLGYGMLQFPMFILMFRGLRGMVEAPVESLATGGALWFPNLLVPDPFYGLSVFACVTFLGNVMMGGESGSVAEDEVSRRIKQFLIVMSLCIVPFTIQFPSAVLVYWVSNSLCSSAQIFLFKLSPVKKYLKLPDVHTEESK